MKITAKSAFDASDFLLSAGVGRRMIRMQAKQVLFLQGDSADCVFYVLSGTVKLTVVSMNGKEATLCFLSAGDFAGEESLSDENAFFQMTAAAFTECAVIKIKKEEITRLLHQEPAFAESFRSFLLKRTIRIQADLVDQLFNCSEKRLARGLLLMANFGKPGEPQKLTPSISHETLAGMIGTTRARVSFFMKRFRDLGFVDYKGGHSSRIQVYEPLLNALLNGQLPLHQSKSGAMVEPVKRSMKKRITAGRPRRGAPAREHSAPRAPYLVKGVSMNTLPGGKVPSARQAH